MAKLTIQSLSISRETYGANAGKLCGAAVFSVGTPSTFNDQKDSIKIGLNDEKCKKFIALVADEIVDAASEFKENLLASISPEPEKTEPAPQA